MWCSHFLAVVLLVNSVGAHYSKWRFVTLRDYWYCFLSLLLLMLLFFDADEAPSRTECFTSCSWHTWSLWLLNDMLTVKGGMAKCLHVYIYMCMCRGGCVLPLCCVGGVWSQRARAWRSELVGQSSVLGWAVCPLSCKVVRRQTRYSNLTHVDGRFPQSLPRNCVIIVQHWRPLSLASVGHFEKSGSKKKRPLTALLLKHTDQTCGFFE